MLSIVATTALALLMAFLLAHPASSYSAGLTICNVTETRMLAGMGGANSPFLSMDLNVTRIDASTATVSVFSTNAKVTSTGIRGLLLWATDATGARVGTWTVRQGQQLFAPVNLCNGGAVSHSGAGVKSFDASSATAPQGFTVTIAQNNVTGPISIRAMVVFTRRVWMSVGPKEVQGLTGQVSGGDGTNDTSTNATSSATCMCRPGAGDALASNVHATMTAIVAALVSLFFALVTERRHFERLSAIS